MKNIAIILTVALMVSCVGCTDPLTVEQATVIAYGSSYTSVTLTLKSGKISKDTVGKIQAVLIAIEPVVSQVATSNDLYKILYPIADDQLKKLITDPIQLGMAEAVVAGCLRLAEQFLANHPEITVQKEYWGKVVTAVFEGAIKGIADSPQLNAYIMHRIEAGA